MQGKYLRLLAVLVVAGFMGCVTNSRYNTDQATRAQTLTVIKQAIKLDREKMIEILGHITIIDIKLENMPGGPGRTTPPPDPCPTCWP